MRIDAGVVPDSVSDPSALARMLLAVGALLFVVDGVIATALSASMPLLFPFSVDLAVVAALLLGGTRPVRSLVLVCGTSLALTVAVQPEWWTSVTTRDLRLDMVPSITEAGLVALLCVFVVRTAPPTTAAPLVAGAGFTLAAAGQFRFVFVSAAVTALTVCFVAAVVLAAAAGMYLRSLDRQHAVEADRARQRERDDLARELHDVVAHHVTAIVVRAQGGQLALARRPEAATDVLSEIEHAGSEALAAMRSMVSTLRSTAALRPTAAYEDLVALGSSSADPGPRVTISVDEAIRTASPVVVASLHRIALEAISNTRRHARDVSGIDVTIEARDGLVVLRAVDDGRTGAARRPGFGLLGVEERAAELHGSARAGWLPGRGWELVASIPLDPPKRAG